MLGDFNFPAIQKTNRYLGPAFFLAFMILVYYIMANMFIAIISNAYDKVREDVKTDIGIFKSLKNVFRRGRKKVKAIDEFPEMSEIDTNNDDTLDQKELAGYVFCRVFFVYCQVVEETS